jgi:peptide/nickel transport system substrate-binding protein
MRVTVVLVGLAITLFLNSTGSHSGPVRSGGRLVSATFTDVRTLNPYLTTDSETAAYSRLINAGLIRLNPLTGEPEPWLAESWKSGADELSWTFGLRKNIYWSDGRPFTGEDVLFTMGIVNDPKIPSFAHDVLTIRKAPIQWQLLETYKIRATLPSRHPTFLRHLDAAFCPILAKHFWANAYSSGKFADVLRADMTGFPSLGAFTLKGFVPGQKLVLSRNSRFWKKDTNGTQLPYLDEIAFLILANQDQAQLRIENNEVDTYQNIRPSDVDRLKAKADVLQMKVLNVGPALEMEGFFLNQNRGTDPATGKPYVDSIKLAWFTDLNFRRALSFAIDRNALVRNALFGHGVPAQGPESPGNRQWFNPELPKHSYSLKTAEDLLKKSGFKQKKDHGKVTLYDRHGNRVRFSLFTNAENSIRNTQCILIVSDLAKLGIEVVYRAMDFGTLIQNVDRTFQFDAVLLGLNRSDVDPGDRRNMLMSSGSLHFWWPRQERPFTPWEKRIDELMTLTMSTTVNEVRKKYYYEVQRIMAEQQPMIFTIHPYAFVCARTKIGNLKPSVLRHRTLWNAEELYWMQ